MWDSFSLSRRASRRIAKPAWSRSSRLGLESLEDRCLMATFLVTTNAPAGNGSLAAAIAQAATGDTINFSDTLAGQPILVPSALTIDKGITIQSSDPNKVILAGAGTDRIFN